MLSNKDIANLVEFETRKNNPNMTIPDTDRISKIVALLLRNTGAKERYWLDVDNDESPLEIIKSAITDALKEVQCVDLVIYCSVDKYLLEPCSANVICSLAKELYHVPTFDVTAGCDGWIKSLQIAQSFIKAGFYKRIMIVSAEFLINNADSVYPKLFNIPTKEQLEYTFPGLTFGEAVTVTVVEDGGDDFMFKNITRNELSDLCTITPHWYDKGKAKFDSKRINQSGPGGFVSYARELFDNTWKNSQFYTDFIDTVGRSNIDIVFTHASSRKDWTEYCKFAKIDDKQYDVYSMFGNCISSSVPIAISIATKEGKVKSGTGVLIITASAGMSHSCVFFKL